nr:glycosyltransferase [Acidianus sp. RZ1]
MLMIYNKLKELGIESKIFTTFKSTYNVLPDPPKGIKGYESAVNSSEYAEKVLKIMNPDRNTVIHIANAMHGLIPIAEKLGAKTLINIQYWWPVCYFNSMDNPDCDCKSFSKISNCIAKKKGGVRAIFSPLETIYALRKLDRIRENVSKASMILAVSNIVKDILVERSFPEEKIRIININALSPPIQYVDYYPSDYFTFAYLSYPDEGKGVFQLVKAFYLASKKNPKIRLKIPGGLEEPKLVSLVEGLNLTNKVIMTGRLPYAEYVKVIPEILKDVDVVVVPTLVPDTWARVVTESMLSGRPVIVTKGNGALVEQVTDMIDGFHVNVYSLEEFASSLYKVSLLSRETIKQMGILARENILRKYDNNKIMGDLLMAYKELIEI